VECSVIQAFFIQPQELLKESIIGFDTELTQGVRLDGIGNYLWMEDPSWILVSHLLSQPRDERCKVLPGEGEGTYWKRSNRL